MKDLNKEKIIKIIKEYKNPYPKDIFVGGDKRVQITTKRFYEFIYDVVENTKSDIIKLILEEDEL